MDHWDAPGEEKYVGLTPAQFNLVFFVIAGAIALGLAIFVGVFDSLVSSSGGDGSSSGPAAMAEETPNPEGERTTSKLTPKEAASAALLTLDDMPSGWEAEPRDDPDVNLELSPGCEILNEDLPPGGTPLVESDRFTGPYDQEVASAASAFATKKKAANAMDEYLEATSRCLEELEIGLKKMYSDLLSSMTGEPVATELSLETLAFQELGDTSAVYRLSGNFIAADVTIPLMADIFFMRAGRVAAYLTYTSIGEVNSLEEEVLAETAAEKLAEANASLAK